MENSVITAATPYEVFIVHMNIGVFGGAAPGAALTPRQRGPCPQPSGWQGRLPTIKARPRRGFSVTLSNFCKNFLDKVIRRMSCVRLSAMNARRIAEPTKVPAAHAMPRARRPWAMVRLGMAHLTNDTFDNYLTSPATYELARPARQLARRGPAWPRQPWTPTTR